MSEILKKFKSVFIVEDEAPATKNVSNDGAAAPSPQQNVVAHAAEKANESGSVNAKFVEILASALEKNNQEGFDYFEFRQALINLGKMSMDESTRFKSAYAMAQTMGVTPEKLVDSAQFYLNILYNEQARFNDAHAQQRDKLIGNREDEAKNLDALAQQKTEQIKQLTQEIANHQKQSEKIRKDVSDATIKIENTKADFEATFASVVAQLQSDVAKIQEHLK